MHVHTCTNTCAYASPTQHIALKRLVKRNAAAEQTSRQQQQQQQQQNGTRSKSGSGSGEEDTRIELPFIIVNTKTTTGEWREGGREGYEGYEKEWRRE